MMTNINLAQALDLSEMAARIQKEVKEEAEIRAIVGDATEIERARQVPKPVGYHILCAIPEIEKEVELGNVVQV